MAKAEMPSADLLLAEVITTKCTCLDQRVALGLERDMGILRMDDIPFVWDLKWEKKGSKVNFHLEIFHVRPRSLKLVADRYFDSI